MDFLTMSISSSGSWTSVERIMSGTRHPIRFVIEAEIISAIKDDRINTKHAISAEIASSARAQNQNERAITACEKELRRNDLSTSQRQELINRICSAAESTSQINIESRDFINSQIEKSHKLPFQIVGLFTLITIGGLCGHALLRKAA